jgi:His-Xaa-Ser system protein HxsD
MSGAEVSLTFDERIYGIEAIQKAAYRSINLFSVDFSIASHNIQHYLNEFKKEVLDQHLRIKIKNESESTRNLILGIAFSNSGLQSNE